MIIAAVTAALMTTFFTVHFYKISTRNAVEKLAAEKKLINLLIAGTNGSDSKRCSFFAILSINPENNNIGITFLPPSYRIAPDGNAEGAVPVSSIESSDFDDLRKTIYRDLKLDVPFFITMTPAVTARFIDLIGGIDIFVLDQVENMDGVRTGLNYFDGDKTVSYINNAVNNSIYIKYDRIQDVLMTLYQKRTELELFRNYSFVSEAMKGVKTNILPQEALSMLEFVFNEGNLICGIVPGGFRDGLYVVDDISYRLFESEFMSGLVLGKESDSPIKVKILNGTSISGLARRMRNYLNRDGLNVVEFSTSPYSSVKKSVIISRKGDIRSIRRVSELTGISKVHYIIDNTQLNNVLVIIGDDIADTTGHR